MKRSTAFSTRRRNAPLLLSAAALLLLLLLSLALGSVAIPLPKLVRALFHAGEETVFTSILLHVRLPRTLAAVTCGAALAVSGALLQATLHNPLAAPNIIGVNAGAGLGNLLLLTCFPALARMAPLAAFAGALAATTLVYGIARRAGAARLTLILAGVAVSSFLGAISDTLITLFPAAQGSRLSFLIGGYSGVSMAQVHAALPVMALGVLLALALSYDLNVLALGGEMAASLGLRVSRVRALALLASALLAGGAVAVSGLLGFIGLIVPHIARRMVGEDQRRLLPLCILLGGGFTLLCDLLARLLFAPFELPVGILLSFLGAPFFIYLLVLEKRHVKS